MREHVEFFFFFHQRAGDWPPATFHVSNLPDRVELITTNSPPFLHGIPNSPSSLFITRLASRSQRSRRGHAMATTSNVPRDHPVALRRQSGFRPPVFSVGSLSAVDPMPAISRRVNHFCPPRCGGTAATPSSPNAAFESSVWPAALSCLRLHRKIPADHPLVPTNDIHRASSRNRGNTRSEEGEAVQGIDRSADDRQELGKSSLREGLQISAACRESATHKSSRRHSHTIA